MDSQMHNREANQAAIERLAADLRVISEVGIERAAWSWNRHEQAGLDAYHAAERDALKAVEAADLGLAWEELRRQLFAMTEGRPALISWQAEHGEAGHQAERAAFGAALGLFTQGLLSHEQYTTLVRPMAEALPWLLPEIPPAPYPD